MPAVDIDILKPDTGKMHIERPTHSATPSAVESPEITTPEPERRHYTEPISEGEDDDEYAVAPANDELKATGLSGEAVAEAIASRKRMLEEQRTTGQKERMEHSVKSTGSTDEAEGDGDDYAADDEHVPLMRGRRTSQLAVSQTNKPRLPRALSIDPLAPSQAFDETFKSRLRTVAATSSEQEQEESAIDDGVDSDTRVLPPGTRMRGDDRELVRYWTAAPGQLIAVPVRVEPKVYFASERTFLVRIRPHLAYSCVRAKYSTTYLAEMAPIRRAHRHDLHHSP